MRDALSTPLEFSVHVFAVTNGDHQNNEGFLFHPIDDSVIANPDSQ